MKLRVRIISIILVALALAGTYVYARSDRSIFEDYSFFSRNKTTVRLWYTDDSLTPYLQSKAVAYSESNSKVRIEPVLVSGLEYLEAVGKASVNEDNFPDLYIIVSSRIPLPVPRPPLSRCLCRPGPTLRPFQPLQPYGY